MALWLVRYAHPDAKGWQAQLMPHVRYLQDLLREGVLRASGPLPDAPVKSAALIIAAESRESLDAIIASDPFAAYGLIEDLTIERWDPIFGVFNADSSMPAAG